MTLFSCFDRIVVINLPERTDRRRQMQAELARAGVAIDDPRLRFFKAIRPPDAGLFPAIGARGCFLSHLQVIEEALGDGVQRLLVLEDDLELAPAACQPQPALAARLLAGDWDFAYAGHIESLGGDPQAPQWQRSEAPLMCAHFYALSARVLPDLRDYLRACMVRPPGHPDGGPMHVDGAYSMFRARQPGCVTLIAAPSLGGQRFSRSDVSPRHWYDQLPGLRTLAALARGIKNRLRAAR